MRNAASFPLRSPQSVCSPAGSDGTPKGMIVTKICQRFILQVSYSNSNVTHSTKNYFLIFHLLEEKHKSVLILYKLLVVFLDIIPLDFERVNWRTRFMSSDLYQSQTSYLTSTFEITHKLFLSSPLQPYTPQNNPHFTLNLPFLSYFFRGFFFFLK